MRILFLFVLALCISDAFITEVYSLGRPSRSDLLEFPKIRSPEDGRQVELNVETNEEEEELASRRRQLAVGDGYWSTAGSTIIDSAGKEVYFSGVTWGGFESPNCVVDGLYPGLGRSLDSHLAQMAFFHFDLIRLPFAGGCLTSGRMPAATAIDFGLNPDLQNLSVVEVMQKVVSAAALRGIRIILDYHRLQPTAPPLYGPEAGLWFDAQNPISDWLSNWQMLATAFKGQTTVVGADLFNEPHPYLGPASGADAHAGPVWDNSTEDYNWRAAAARAASLIQAIEPGWLICVQGMWQNACWGENLQAVVTYPLHLPVANRLVYEIHDYGPLVSPNAWLSDPTFPANLPSFWDKNWGFLTAQNITPVWVGEFGSTYELTNGSDINVREIKWFSTLVPYIKKMNVSWTYFTWGPNSVDTGGILEDNWHMANVEKLTALQPILFPNFELQSATNPLPPLASSARSFGPKFWNSILVGVVALMVRANLW